MSYEQAGMDTNLAVMTVGATFGVTYALERMGRSKGGRGGRIITTASTAGLTVSKRVLALNYCRAFSLIDCMSQKFVDCGLDGGGYAISKHENVVLTRMFPHFKPDPLDDDVKAYALCPVFVPTRLVLDEFGIKDREEAKRHAAREVYKGRGTRFLTFEEVGEAMMHSLKKDVSGACYFISPDMPIIHVPDTGVIHMTMLVLVGKFVAALGITDLSKKGLGIALFFLLYVGFFLLNKIICMLFSLIF